MLEAARADLVNHQPEAQLPKNPLSRLAQPQYPICRKFRPLGVRVRNVRALSRKSIFAESGMAAFGSSNGRPEALDRPASAGWHHRAFRIASKIMTEVRSAPIFPRRSKKS